jgi:hypothetical protein
MFLLTGMIMILMILKIDKFLLNVLLILRITKRLNQIRSKKIHYFFNQIFIQFNYLIII